jgi:hypothetical protein
VLVPSQTPPPPGCGRHTWPVAHEVQGVLPVPHAVATSPGRHLSPTQQPSQFDGLHEVEPHVLVTTSHARPWEAQSVHATPERPQAAASVPLRHQSRPSSTAQQPEHVSGPHEGSSRPQTR